MLVLGIEASTACSSVALVRGETVVAAASLGVPRRHGEFLTPAVRFCLEQAGLGIDEVNGVAVGTGPGLFTGLRVGIATAQTFAAARELPVVGLSSLDVLAFPARHTRRLLCAAVDARRGELYWAFYRSAPGGVQRVGEMQLGSLEVLVAELESHGEPCLVVGDATIVHHEALSRVAEVAGPDAAWPSAAHLAELAHPRFVREETERADQLRPIYLRQPDAAIGWQERGRLQGGGART
ncbi:tRNA (adenosine(37)-N6)-threonylcarbamoyltransferase complex dimerization subunit type 1 TsaB [Nitriliruptoraceae bacterium ZYF776]|nr:tRNA (adenosine(37)-N6)-threonylcarbamoyltransferase complex dimerization subunit type 1 TsaB [Profundirhabdus halotolerans]